MISIIIISIVTAARATERPPPARSPRSRGPPARHSQGLSYLSELIRPVTVSSQSTRADAIQPLQGFNMHPTITS